MHKYAYSNSPTAYNLVILKPKYFKMIFKLVLAFKNTTLVLTPNDRHCVNCWKYRQKDPMSVLAPIHNSQTGRKPTVTTQQCLEEVEITKSLEYIREASKPEE